MATILIIEDDDLNRLMFAEFFAAIGYRSATASKATEGIMLASQEPPVLILLDWHLPGGVNGLEAAQILKANPQLRHIPILIISAHYEPDIEQRVLAAGGAGFVRKPVDLKSLRKLVKSLVDDI